MAARFAQECPGRWAIKPAPGNVCQATIESLTPLAPGETCVSQKKHCLPVILPRDFERLPALTVSKELDI